MIYYLTTIPDEIKAILLEDDEDLFPQENLPDKEEYPTIVEELVKSGRLALFYKYNVIIFLRRGTAFVGIFDTKVAKCATAKDVIKAYKEFFEWAKEGTEYIKLETRTPLEKYGRIMAKATGASLEGTRKCSYKTKENKMVDEYEYGYVLRGID